MITSLRESERRRSPVYIWQMISMVIFDMAGTTVNENNVVYKTLRQAINENGFHFTLEQVLEAGAGKEKLQAIKSILKTEHVTDDGLSEDIYRRFIVYLKEAYEQLDVQPQRNAVEIFRILMQNGIRTILNTGYDAKTAIGLVDKLGWEIGKTFDGLITASDVNNNRPDPDMILLAMKNFGIENADEVVKVGDSVIDIEEGKNAGCAMSIGITTGAHTYEQLQSANPDYIIHDLMELTSILNL